jgi:hypothetical protein
LGFIGSINDKLRKFFWTQADVLSGRRCYIGCSGNFTIEQIITTRCKDAEIHSNDVSLYSSAVGFALTGRRLAMQVMNPELAWAQEYIDRGNPEAIATLLLLLDMFQYEKRKNPFSVRMWDTYLVQWAALHAKTTAKVADSLTRTKVHEYTMTDVYDYYPRPDGVSIGFLPTYVGGYEKLFARLEESITWPDKPAYDMLTKERREETLQKMTEGDYILYDDVERELPCVARVELFGKHTVYIYSNLFFKKGLFRRTVNEKIARYQLLMPEEEIPADADIVIKPCDLPTINHYRNMYLSKKIQPGSGGPCFLAFAGGKLFGFIIFQAYSQKGGDKNEIYLLSDFVVPSSRHKRLAKLLLLVLKSGEMKRQLDELCIRDYKSIMTTAFTDKPVSMKYRGIFELGKRGQGFLNYHAKFDDTVPLKEIVNLWKARFNKP